MGGRGSSGGGGGGSASNARMPALTGSEKQVKWASDIRDGALAAADANVRNSQRNVELGIKPSVYTPSVEASSEVRSSLVKAFQGQTSAKAIIDSRAQFSQDALTRRAAAIDRRNGRI